MSRFSKVVAGTRVRAEAVLPLLGAMFDVEADAWIGPIEKLHVRALNDNEYADVLKNALAFAKKHGVENPENGDPLYEMGKWLHTLAIACIDSESPLDNPQPYFDGGWEQIHKSEVLTAEVIAYLYEQQQLHQEQVNPLAKDLTPDQLEKAIVRFAAGDMLFFVNMRRGLQWTCMRFSASQLIALRASKSESTPRSEPQSETES